MISALAHSGPLEEARDAVRPLLKVQPNANVAQLRGSAPGWWPLWWTGSGAQVSPNEPPAASPRCLPLT